VEERDVKIKGLEEEKKTNLSEIENLEQIKEKIYQQLNNMKQ